MIHGMYDCECMTLKANEHHISILDNLFDCRQLHLHINLKEKKLVF